MIEGEPALQLDRMEIEETGANPERLAAEVHRQLDGQSTQFSIPIEQIAAALDINEIRTERLDNFEGALLTTRERGKGQILVNLSASPQRRRFTITHELGHYLNLWHRPVNGSEDNLSFMCSKSDLGSWSGKQQLNRHQTQEREANRFAIELLAPERLMRVRLNLSADLKHILAIANQLQISKEAAARRYVELHEECIAVAFSKKGRLSYWARSTVFPRTTEFPAGQMPALPLAPDTDTPTSFIDAEPSDWFVHRPRGDVLVQTYHQQNGYAMSLLVVEQTNDPDDETDDGIEDSSEQFDRFNGG